MCFSAPASFTAAAIAGAAGVGALSRVDRRAELPLAAMPMFFAIQQLIEGWLWLTLPVASSAQLATQLTQIFLLLALVFWPVFAPLAVLGVETDKRRRAWITACLVCGIIAASYFLWKLHTNPQTAMLLDHHIVYSGNPDLPAVMRVLYPVATCLAPVLSSHKVVRLLGVIVALGSIAAFLAFWGAFTSVWCFFAATASGVVLFQFEHARRQRQHAI